ncbi:MAG: hypothetical protein CMJ06_00650 [Pelagibacterales bacterium]|nr:hypothetical protein [Pelagibacterales bacterium]OUU63556.1 MAG: hypothetical protein CBC22_00620 [Alphaproteobacteria bacterium TMED62]|tara:strand:- start:2380 stop:2625 length:246 start_codon:yes stop_codon:yes gene_type:complete
MSILEIIIFFLVVWWPVFFILLPIGYQQLPQARNFKFAKSAPKKPNILIKFIFASIFSLIITFAFWLMAYLNIFSLKSLIL